MKGQWPSGWTEDLYMSFLAVHCADPTEMLSALAAAAFLVSELSFTSAGHTDTGHSKEKSLNITLLGFLSPCCMTSCTFLH